MNSLRDLLINKVEEIDQAGKRDDVHIVQTEVSRYFSGAEVQSIKPNGAALITTASSAVASDLRLRQFQMISDLNSLLKNKLTRFHIRIQQQ